jgi:hypothetical protein
VPFAGCSLWCRAGAAWVCRQVGCWSLRSQLVQWSSVGSIATIESIVRNLLLLCSMQDGCADEFPCVWRLLGRWVTGSLLRRMVATEAGILFGGRSYSLRNNKSLEYHWMTSPVLRVFGCAEGSGGALAGCLDRDRLGCATGGPTNSTSSRLPAHILSRPLSAISRYWTVFGLNCVLSSGCQSSRVRSPDAKVARRVKQLETKMPALARQSQQPASNCGNTSDYHRCWTSTSNATMVLNIAHCSRRYSLHPSG